MADVKNLCHGGCRLLRAVPLAEGGLRASSTPVRKKLSGPLVSEPPQKGRSGYETTTLNGSSSMLFGVEVAPDIDGNEVGGRKTGAED